MESRVILKLAEEAFDGNAIARAAFAEKNSDFQQCDGAYRDRFVTPDGLTQNSRLLPRKPLGGRKPAHDNVRVEQESWAQRRAPARSPTTTSHRSDVSASSAPRAITTLPAQEPSGDFHLG